MGVNLCEVSFSELWLLVLKRCVYLVAKFISFKGMAFIVCCAFLYAGVISGVVWCSLILGIITNRTGKQIMNTLGKGDSSDEKENETACDAAPARATAPALRSGNRGKSERAAESAKERIRGILANGDI
ncbi:MAG: hypothetical protein IJ558_00370 [Treponema sp.]|nr:hypothetical protein [Treponema sp.]